MTKRKHQKKSVALTYDYSGAPKISATGKGIFAHEIIDRAREADIPIIEDPKLASLLASIPLGDEIPVELYQAVAEVLAFVLRLELGLSEHS